MTTLICISKFLVYVFYSFICTPDFINFCPPLKMVVNGHTSLHFRTSSICDYFFMYALISIIFCPPLRVAVNCYSYLHFGFIYICASFLMYKTTFIIYILSKKMAVNGHPYWNFRLFCKYNFFPYVYTYFYLFLIRMAVNGHSYLNFGLFYICAYFLMYTPTFIICFPSIKVVVSGDIY
jgi:hypothetical protein